MAALFGISLLLGLGGCGEKPVPTGNDAPGVTDSVPALEQAAPGGTGDAPALEQAIPFSKRGEPVLSGGTVDRSDPLAPKEIVSREITELDADFTLFTRWSGERDDHDYHFQIQPGEGGVLTVTETRRGLSRPADAGLLEALQKVIEENGLAALNGVDKFTAGLAPGYQPGGLRVTYASGETLRFRVNNDPHALWAEEFYDIFAAWFSGQGEEGLYQPKE